MPAAKMCLLLLLFFFISLPCLTLSRLEQHHETIEGTKPNSRTVIDVEGGPDSVVWVVQLSDLHFSVFHPDRADDLKRVVGPSLALINPSLVLITGDLTGILVDASVNFSAFFLLGLVYMNPSCSFYLSLIKRDHGFLINLPIYFSLSCFGFNKY